MCGCPYSSVGGELAAQDRKVQTKTRDLINRQVEFLAATIRDAQTAGDAAPGDAESKARLVHAFVIGLLLRAKIFNDLKLLDRMEEGVFALSGTPLTLATPGRRRAAAQRC